MFLKMFLWCSLWKSFLVSMEFWSWAVSASPKGQSVGEQSVLQAFTLILFENKGAKTGRGRENTQIKGKRSWNHASNHAFGLMHKESLSHWWKCYSSKKAINFFHKAGLSFIQALLYLLYFFCNFYVLSTSPNKMTFRPQVMLLCTAFGEKKPKVFNGFGCESHRIMENGNVYRQTWQRIC